MSNLEKFPKRINDLFSEQDLLDPDPEKGAPAPEDKPVENRPQPHSQAAQPKPSDATLTRLKWEDYLNAIDRDEKIGFVYAQDEVSAIPKAEFQNQQSASDVRVDLQIGDELLGALQLEGDLEIDAADKDLLAAIAQQVSQHLENLRLLEQAEQFRSEAEQASQRLTHEGWQDYLQSTEAPTSGFVYDRNRVVPVNHDVDIFASTGQTVMQDLKVRDALIGQIAVDEVQQDLDTASNLLANIGERLSTHIESLRLLDETERARQQLDRRAAELETVAQVSTAAATTLDPDALLQSVVELTRYSFNLYHVSIYLLDENGEILNLVAAAGRVGQQMLAERHQLNLQHDKSLVSQVAVAQEILVVRDSETDPNFLYFELLPETRSEIAVPLIVGDQLLGVFDVKSEIPNRFSEEDHRTYATLASQTAVALRNAQLYAEQMATVERLKELDNMKSAFLANMSHELRTPLNSILGFTQVMLEGLDGPLTEYMQDDLQLIEKNGKHLLNLINDVLDMARIEAGRVSFYIESVNLPLLLDDVLRTNNPMAREKSLQMEFISTLEERQIVMADSVRLRQVLINVVGNALKFTPAGSVMVYADQFDDMIQIRVKDSGIGVPPSKLEAIFEAFSQVDTSTTRKVGGTGLGLPISRRLVEMHGGRMWAESTGVEGAGTTIFIELPIDGPEDQSKEKAL